MKKPQGRPKKYEICEPEHISIHTTFVKENLNNESNKTGVSKSVIINEALTKRYEKTNKKTKE